MADDTPELGRLVVLHHALLELLVTSLDVRGLPQWDAAARELAKETDALVMRIAHRTRSAQNYHNTARGDAAIHDAMQIVAALKDPTRVHKSENASGRTDSSWIELVDYVWDKDQLDNPIQAMTEDPRRKIVRRWYVDPNLRFLSEELQPDFDPS